jgi:cell division protein FtsB
MTDDFVTREAAGQELQHTMFLCGQLAVVRNGLRTRVNDLNKSIEERKQIYETLKAEEATLVEQIDHATARLSEDDARWMQEQKGML